jgi:3,4-dihydroxy 2-butanone 4-phosphate synthase
MAGMKPAAVLCEITNPDGTMAKGRGVEQFAMRHGLVTLSIAELVEHRSRQTESTPGKDNALASVLAC